MVARVGVAENAYQCHQRDYNQVRFLCRTNNIGGINNIRLGGHVIGIGSG